MKLPFGKSKAVPGAVPVSLNMQRWIIGSLVAEQIVQTSFIFPTFFHIPRPEFPSYVWSLLGFDLFPVVIFGIAYLSSGAYSLRTNRIFIAMLKTIVITSLFGMLQAVKNYAGLLVAQHRGNGNFAPPPAWITSFVYDDIVMGLCIAGFLLFIFIQSRKQK